MLVWETATGREMGRYENLPGGASHLGFSPDGRWLSVCSRKPYEFRILHATTGRLAIPPLPVDSTLVSAQFSPDAKHLAVGTTSGLVDLWDLGLPGPGSAPTFPRTTSLHPLIGRHDGVVWMTEFCQDGRQ